MFGSRHWKSGKWYNIQKWQSHSLTDELSEEISDGFNQFPPVCVCACVCVEGRYAIWCSAPMAIFLIKVSSLCFPINTFPMIQCIIQLLLSLHTQRQIDRETYTHKTHTWRAKRKSYEHLGRRWLWAKIEPNVCPAVSEIHHTWLYPWPHFLEGTQV